MSSGKLPDTTEELRYWRRFFESREDRVCGLEKAKPVEVAVEESADPGATKDAEETAAGPFGEEAEAKLFVEIFVK